MENKNQNTESRSATINQEGKRDNGRHEKLAGLQPQHLVIMMIGRRDAARSKWKIREDETQEWRKKTKTKRNEKMSSEHVRNKDRENGGNRAKKNGNWTKNRWNTEEERGLCEWQSLSCLVRNRKCKRKVLLHSPLYRERRCSALIRGKAATGETSSSRTDSRDHSQWNRTKHVHPCVALKQKEKERRPAKQK